MSHLPVFTVITAPGLCLAIESATILQDIADPKQECMVKSIITGIETGVFRKPLPFLAHRVPNSPGPAHRN